MGMPWTHVLQALAAIAMIAFLAYVHTRSRPLALAFVWVVWLTTPFLRRLISFVAGPAELDVLALAPFAATALAAILEFRLVRLDRRTLVVLGTAALGFLLGVIEGLSQPQALAFALVAYGSALSAAVIGYSERRRSQQSSLFRVLMILGPPVAAYGVAQYFMLPFLPWDESWVDRSGLASIGAPGLPDRIRVFATLNAPAVFAAVMAVVALALLTARRVDLAWMFSGAAVATGLALTYVRSAWLSLVAASVILIVATMRRDTALRTVATAAAICLAIGAGAILSYPTPTAIVDRALTLRALEQDVSARERAELVEETVREIIGDGTRRPGVGGGLFGHGLGQVGVATRLATRTPLSSADNGYLAVLYQVGPVGTALIVLSLMVVAWTGARSIWAQRHEVALRTHTSLLVATLGAMALLHWFMDALHGVLGAIVWYVSGRLLAPAELDDMRDRVLPPHD